jgi:hypothetical protein
MCVANWVRNGQLLPQLAAQHLCWVHADCNAEHSALAAIMGFAAVLLQAA